MGSKVVKRVTFIAERYGWYENKRIRAGEAFTAPEGEEFSWARLAGSEDQSAGEDIAEAEKGGSRVMALLEASAQEVAQVIPSLTDAELQAFIDAESGSKRRKGVLKLAEDERSNRVGRMGGSEERAKQPEEKDPLPIDNSGPVSDEDNQKDAKGKKKEDPFA